MVDEKKLARSSARSAAAIRRGETSTSLVESIGIDGKSRRILSRFPIGREGPEPCAAPDGIARRLSRIDRNARLLLAVVAVSQCGEAQGPQPRQSR